MIYVQVLRVIFFGTVFNTRQRLGMYPVVYESANRKKNTVFSRSGSLLGFLRTYN